MLIFKTICKFVTERREKKYLQKQPPEVFHKNSIPKKFQKIYRKTSVSESLSQTRLQHKCFSVDFVKFLRAPIL